MQSEEYPAFAAFAAFKTKAKVFDKPVAALTKSDRLSVLAVGFSMVKVSIRNACPGAELQIPASVATTTDWVTCEARNTNIELPSEIGTDDGGADVVVGAGGNEVDGGLEVGA